MNRQELEQSLNDTTSRLRDLAKKIQDETEKQKERLPNKPEDETEE